MGDSGMPLPSRTMDVTVTVDREVYESLEPLLVIEKIGAGNLSSEIQAAIHISTMIAAVRRLVTLPMEVEEYPQESVMAVCVRLAELMGEVIELRVHPVDALRQAALAQKKA